MNTQDVLDPKSWAERTFGSVQLQDMRRTRRAVQAATNLAENPVGSLPAQMRTWKETKAVYRLRDEPDVTFAALMQPHLQQTREQALSSPVVLMVQDTTDSDLSHRRKISGVGQKGLERGRGFFVQTVLAVRPPTREVLGCMAQEPFVRIPAPEGEQRYQRRKREARETAVWMRQVHAIGTPALGSVWVHVGDPRADMFPFFQACQATQTHFLVRAAQNRRVEVCEDEISYALTQARAFPSQASRPFEVPARHGRQARSTQLQLACGQMTLLPPRHEPRASKKPLTVWVVRFCSNVASASPCFTRWHKASMDFTIPASSSWRSTFASSCRTCPAIACNRCSKSCRRRLYSSRATRLRQVGIRQALSLLFQTHTRFPEMLAPRLEFLWQPL